MKRAIPLLAALLLMVTFSACSAPEIPALPPDAEPPAAPPPPPPPPSSPGNRPGGTESRGSEPALSRK